MDFDLGDQATGLRSRLRALIAAHIAEDDLGTCNQDDAAMARATVEVELPGADG